MSHTDSLKIKNNRDLESIIESAQLFPHLGEDIWVVVIDGFASDEEVREARKEALSKPSLEFSGGFGGVTYMNHQAENEPLSRKPKPKPKLILNVNHHLSVWG